MGNITRRALGSRPARLRPKPAAILRDRLILVLEALPLATFAGLILGISYMVAFLGRFHVKVHEVAALSDYLLAAVYGLGAVAATAGAVLGGIYIALKSSPKHPLVSAIVFTFFAALSCVFAFGYELLLRVNRAIIHALINNGLYDYLSTATAPIYFILKMRRLGSDFLGETQAIFVFSMLAVSLLSFAYMSFLGGRITKRSAALGLLLLTGALTVAASVSGGRAAEDQYMASFTRVGEHLALPRYVAASDSPIKAACPCDAYPAWSGDVATVYVCSNKAVVVHGAESIVLEPGGAVFYGIRPTESWGDSTYGLSESARNSCRTGAAINAAEKSPSQVPPSWEQRPRGKFFHLASQDTRLGLGCVDGRLLLYPSWIPKEETTIGLRGIQPDGRSGRINGLVSPSIAGGVVSWLPTLWPLGRGQTLEYDGHAFDISKIYSELNAERCFAVAWSVKGRSVHSK